MKLLTAASLLALALPGTAWAEDIIPPVVGGQTWVQHRIVAIRAAHPGIARIEVEGARDSDKQTIVFGATDDAGKVMQVVEHPLTATGSSRMGRQQVVRLPFMSNSGHRLGTIAYTFARPAKANLATAQMLTSRLALTSLSVKNSLDPWPWDPAYRRPARAQQLVDRTIAAHPELLVMMIHATPPGGAHNIVIGSNIARIGKAADEDDLRVIEKGSTNLEVAESGDRFETELPLNDASGTRIGALGLVFKLNPGADKEAIHARGRAIRDHLARQISSNAALFAPAR